MVWNTRVVGAEHVPASGPVVIAANHVSIIDGPLVHGVLPRGTHILVKQEMFHGPVGGILRAAGQIPVDRNSGRRALEAALGVLRRGGAVGIFPEGNRGRGDVSGVRAGVAWLAVHGAAPVVPAAVLGTRRTGEPLGHVPGLRRRLVVELGPPIQVALPPDEPRRQAVGRTAEVVAEALSAHVRQAAARHGLPLPLDDPRALPGS
ncbi:lysophospholipid acyltransferase family protein [Isoptericola sp. b490]|uniref:lysophospholipid acyltransferase family protein n=1 Tax=Actinotalea lenta TaxID=3064654 RepID=UPI0027129C66|nr:lysophospholipid acyltransferase family protein [Isoptericola sp. b490]MDO8120650.1 lysophospholipid acyltransferase family protein [Isoptericola sp. b490]